MYSYPRYFHLLALPHSSVIRSPHTSQSTNYTGAIYDATSNAWRFFFEFRVLGNLDSVLKPAEILAIRATNRRLYREISDFLPAEQVKTEFRQSIITAGHGANPPKSAKNYPNQTQIRQAVGYRNIIFANQVQEKMRKEVIPALQAAIPADWAHAAWFADTLLRANALSVVAHEETHPWATFGGIPWLEELKCDILGLYSILQTPLIQDEIADLLVSSVASDLLLHRYHTYLQKRGDSQFDDYHTGGTIWLTHLYRGGFFRLDGDDKVIDVERSQAVPLLERFAKRMMAIKAGRNHPQRSTPIYLIRPMSMRAFMAGQRHSPTLRNYGPVRFPKSALGSGRP